MTVDEAKKIKEKSRNCHNRILDTRYCEEMSCSGCEYHVTDEEIQKACEVLGEVNNDQKKVVRNE